MDDDKKYELIDELDLRFEKLNPKTSPQDINYIYSNFAYTINIDVIRTILSSKEKWDEHAFNTKNYSYIKECYPDMAEYILRNISDYIVNVFLQLEQNTYIHETDFVELINNPSLANEQKLQIIQKCKCKVNDINSIEDTSLRSEICKNDKMEATWENVRVMINTDKDSAAICDTFLNIKDNAEQLSHMDLLENEDDSTEDHLGYKLLHRDKIRDYSYVRLVSKIEHEYDKFDSSKISAPRMRFLINSRKVSANKNGYEFLKKNYKDLHILLLEKRSDEFADSFSELKLDSSDLSLVLNSRLASKDKVILINNIDATIFDEDTKVLHQLGKWLLDYPGEITSISVSIVEALCKSAALQIQVRIYLYVKYSDIISDDLTFISSLGEEYTKMANKQRVAIPHTDENIALRKVLSSKGFIESCRYIRKGEYYSIKLR